MPVPGPAGAAPGPAGAAQAEVAAGALAWGAAYAPLPGLSQQIQ